MGKILGKTGKKRRMVSWILSFAMAFASVPLHLLAAGTNHMPKITEAYLQDTEPKTIEVNSRYCFDLNKVFTDPDGDALTFYVSLNGSAYRRTERKCIYTPDEPGELTISFKASDGKAESAEYTVHLMAVEGKETGIRALGMEEQGVKLDSLIIHTGVVINDSSVLVRNQTDSYSSGSQFQTDVLEYTLTGEVYDNNCQLGFRAKPEQETDVVTLCYGDISKDITWTKAPSKYVNFLTAGKQEFSIVVSAEDETRVSTTYTFYLDVIPTISKLSIRENVYWDDPEAFDADIKEYHVTVADTLKELTFDAEPASEGCKITYNGQTTPVVDISGTDQVEIVISKDGISNTYLLKLDKRAESSFYVQTMPEGATVSVYDHQKEKLEANEDGSFSAIFSKYQHTYTVSLNGYTTKSGTVPENGGTILVTLDKILGKQPDEVDCAWYNFRNSDDNMAITDAPTPRSEDVDSVSPKWIKDFRQETGAYPSVPIIADQALVVMAGTTLYKLDLETGEVLLRAEMAAQPNYGYTPPTYAKGMIFCPLSGGIIQAFNAETLESLWIYRDDLGGQALSPIAYSDGYIYTGFWNSEEKDANFVCISITDEEVEKTQENKEAVWKQKQKGGFYWAGAVVVGNAVIVGTDDGAKEGENGTARLYSFNKENGTILSEYALTGAGDQRSSIAYDKGSGKVYFTTKGGRLYSGSVNTKTGELSGLTFVVYDGQSTSTPVVYQGRVYFGLGNGFTEGYLVAADADTLNELFRVRLKGYPQSSALLSTAYEADSGCLYLYSTYNNHPGGISVVKVKADCKTASDAVLTELYDASGYSEHCIASVICGEDGTLYYKNDTGNIFAIGLPTYQNVIKLIDEIGSVTLDSEGKITAARAAYAALSSTEQKKVTNRQTLENAEARLKELWELKEEAAAVDTLILKIGTVTLNSNEKIAAAESAYESLAKKGEESKTMVRYLEKLKTARETYNQLKAEAIEEVEALIDTIGEVTLNSQSAIEAAREAYDDLPEHIQALIDNIDVLEEAEEEWEELQKESAKTKKLTTKKKSATTSSKSAVTKSELLKIQEKIQAANEQTSYEEAMELLKRYYDLEEEQQLALADEEGLAVLQNITARENQKDEDTGILLKNADWKVRLVVETVEDPAAENEITQKFTEGSILEIWDIYLEDVLTEERYEPENMVEIWIPLELLEQKDAYEEFSILHYGEDHRIEILNCESLDGYLVFHTIDFSYYAVIGYEGLQENTKLPDAEESSRQKEFGWMIWAALAGAGLGLLGGLLYLIRKKREEEENVES